MVDFFIFNDISFSELSEQDTKITNNLIKHFDDIASKGEELDFIINLGGITKNCSYEEYKHMQKIFELICESHNIKPKDILLVPDKSDYYIKNNNQIGLEKFTHNDSKGQVFNKNFKHFYKEFYKKKIEEIPSKQVISSKGYKIQISFLNFDGIFWENQEIVNIEHFIKNSIDEKFNYDLSLLIFYNVNKTFSKIYIPYIEELEKLCDILIIKLDKALIDDRIDVENPHFLTIYLSDEESIGINKRYKTIEFLEFLIDVLEPKIILKSWFTKSKHDYCAFNSTFSQLLKSDGSYDFYIRDREVETDSYLTDPLCNYYLDKELKDFFKRNIKNLLRVENRNDIKKMRNLLPSDKRLKYTDFSMIFLKFCLESGCFENASQLEDYLKTSILMKECKKMHKRIILFYSDQYFSKPREGIDKQIFMKLKGADKISLKKEIEALLRENLYLKRNMNSAIELYSERPRSLFPPLLDPPIYEPIESSAWYKNIGLFADPFPSTDGLDSIHQDLRNSVIYKTKIIEEFENDILSGIQNLKNRTFCINGAYGSGKTTLFQYMESLLKIHNPTFLVLSFPLESRITLEEIRKKFFFTLFRELRQINFQINQYNQPSGPDVEESCLDLLELLHSSGKEALFIFVEDIYKPSIRLKNIKEVLGFIESLQIYKRRFSSGILPTSIFFSAIDEISLKLQGDHSTSGSIDVFRNMSTITYEDALEMINLRLKVFSNDEENPYQITSSFLASAVSIEKQSGKSVKTFRDYLLLLTKRFRRGEFELENIEFKLDDDIVSNIRLDIENSHPEINECFIELRELTDENFFQFQKCIEITEKLWRGKFIFEDTSEANSKFVFLTRLFKTNLIQKVLDGSRVGWSIPKRLNKYYTKIHDAYRGVNPKNIVPAVYFSEKESQFKNKILARLSNLIKRGDLYGSKFVKLLKSVEKAYSEIFDYSSSTKIIESKTFPTEKRKLMINSSKEIITALVIQNDSDVDSFDEAILLLENSWYEKDFLISFIQKLGMLEREEKLNKINSEEYLKLYLEFIDEIVGEIRRYVQHDTHFTLKNQNISNIIKKDLQAIRRNLDSGEVEKASNKIEKMLLQYLKRYYYNQCRLIFGIKKWKSGIPQEINLKLSNRISRKASEKNQISEETWVLILFFEELVNSIDYLDTIIVETKITHLHKVNKLIQKIFPLNSADYPWTKEILKLVVLINNFPRELFNGLIEYPWLKKSEDQKDYYLKKHFIPDLNSLRLFLDLTFPFSLDFMFYFVDKKILDLDFPNLIYSIISLKETISIDYDYKSDEIIVDLLENKELSSEEKNRIILERKIKTKDFDVFLCYNTHDKKEIIKIGNKLKKKGILPWLDLWEIKPGEPWISSLENQISTIKAAAVFVGEKGIGPWEDMEIKAILNEFMEEKKNIIPVILKNAKSEPEIPLFLKILHWVDFRKQDPNPIRQLVWGITGEKQDN